MKAKLCAFILTLLVATVFVAGSVSHGDLVPEKQVDFIIADGDGTPPDVDHGI